MLKGKLASSTQIFKDPGKEKSRTETFGDGCEIPDQVPYPQMVCLFFFFLFFLYFLWLFNKRW